MEEPLIGAESWFFSLILSIILILYAIIFIPVVRRNFRIKSKNRYNSFLTIILLIFIAIFISLPYSTNSYYLYMPLNYYCVVVAGSLAIFFFLYALIKGKKYEAYDLNKNLEDDLDNSMDRVFLDVYNFTPKQEMQRKFIHLLSILYLLAWTLEPIIFYGVQFLYAGIANTTTAENYYNAKLLFEYEDTELILYNGLVVQFFMFICIFMVNANIEIMRLRFREYDYFMKRVILKTRRPTELYDITASNLLLLGLATSAIILTYSSEYKLAGIYAQMAVICITVLSDMFAALIGRRFGKHKWPLLKGKSIEGSLAGFLVGFFTAMIFVGWFLALIGAFIFVFTDIILAKVEISDNASNPILLAIIFKCLIIFVNPMITILPIIKIW